MYFDLGEFTLFYKLIENLSGFKWKVFDERDQFYSIVIIIILIFMLNHIQRTFGKYYFAIEKRLFVYDSGRNDPKDQSGIRATIFGPTGILKLNYRNVGLFCCSQDRSDGRLHDYACH